MSHKTITIEPEYRFYFWWFFFGFFLVPVFGIGLILFWIGYRKKAEFHYEISDRAITVRNSSVEKHLTLAHITDSKVRQRWIDRKLGTGTIILFSDEDSLELTGIENPETISGLILKAAAAERDRLRPKPRPKEVVPVHPPGTLDKLDYLTGLWQQGLLSDEDYQKERKHFGN
ncbi:MAG: PH domain-containing protein [Balneolaceae bacterium]|nr:MAG: PH domain-containing protein [Balneolaceae bacterium]